MNSHRRCAIGALLVLAAAPIIPAAQAATRRIAWFGAGSAQTPSPFFATFRAGLSELGWIDGQNIALSQFLTDGPREEVDRLALRMLATQPDIIVAHGRDTFPVHRAKPSVPVVFGFSGDPVDAGFVQSFARPGTNFTGISFLSLELAAKRIELLAELVPQVRRLAVLARPEHAGEHRERAASEAIVKKLGISMIYAPYDAPSALEGALQTIASHGCDALVAFPDGSMLANSPRIAKFAREAKLPAVSGWAGFADNGFLLTYGPRLADAFRGLARYVDQILRGARPQELPVELPRTVELVINAQTARALDIRIPPSALARADRVIG
ncbi:MAG TPA: ABC transporter substrate-binding protein [Casimicrobiaceae bacterium]|nr:ABC transporter substrate-binding protein [Casimicrobiaceae bacterium]